MEKTKELNTELQSTVNKRFEELLKEIGSNRQQLSTKVSMAFREFHKELSKEKVTSKRGGEILAEITKIEKMAAQQLPHHLRKPAPVPAVKKVVVAKAEKNEVKKPKVAKKVAVKKVKGKR